MAFCVVGTSHHIAPVEVRERFVFGPRDARAALRRLRETGAASEAVLLTTCNRTELYLFGGHGGGDAAIAAARSVLAARAGLSVADAARYLYDHRDRSAVRHLFRVTSSLDAMVLGEAQIQGQVRTAYEEAAAAAEDARSVGPMLSRLFQTALGVGARVRNETRLGAGAASVPAAAVELAKKIFGPLRGRRALVLGAGEMSELALECLRSEGVDATIVATRTTGRARALAGRVGCDAVHFDQLPARLDETDIIACATASPHAVLTRDVLERALPDGPARPLYIIDIALPRDVEPAVAELGNVFLYDIDDLRQIVDENLQRRRAEVPGAEAILTAAVEDFWAWYASLSAVPVIRAYREHAEALRQLELERAMRKLQHLSPDDRDAVDLLTRQLLNKLLHGPTDRLRRAATNGYGAGMLAAAKWLLTDAGRGEDPDRETG